MKLHTFLAWLQGMQMQLVAIVWPLWWNVFPFLFFYSCQNGVHIPIIIFIF